MKTTRKGAGGQAQGRHLRGLDGSGGTWLGETLSVGHPPNVGTRSARHVVGEGALRGRSPRTREGRIGPTAQNCSGQWLVVSGQRRRYTYFRVESGLGMGPLLPEEWDSSPQNWDAPSKSAGLLKRRKAARMRAAVYFICCAERPSTYRRELCRSTR